MGEDLYRLISTGLLAVIVLLLLLAVSQLSRLRGSLREGPASTASPPEPEPLTEAPRTETVPHDTTAIETAPETESRAAATEEGPYERDGRWWFRRDEELLVYDEQLEEWVDPAAVASPQPEAVPAAQPVAAPEPHPLDEARDWTGPDEVTTPTDSAPAPGAGAAEPVTAPAPIAEPADAPAPVQGEQAGHWKCPACGVINGSTTTSCRMCFTARP